MTTPRQPKAKTEPIPSEQIGDFVKLATIHELLKGVKSDFKDSLSDLVQQLNDINRSMEKANLLIAGLDPKAHHDALLQAYKAHTETALTLLHKLEERADAERAAEVVERAARRELFSKAAHAIWEKGGGYLVLGLIMLILGLLARYADLPLPLITGGSH